MTLLEHMHASPIVTLFALALICFVGSLAAVSVFHMALGGKRD